jgi:hypothetical protein
MPLIENGGKHSAVVHERKDVNPLADKNVGDLSSLGAHPERFFAWCPFAAGGGRGMTTILPPSSVY